MFPEGIHLLFVPPYSPVQAAERLWELVNEPLVNRSFDSLDDLENVLVNTGFRITSIRFPIHNSRYLSTYRSQILYFSVIL